MDYEEHQQMKEEIENLRYCVRWLVNVLVDDDSLLDDTKANLKGTIDEWLD